jgi:REP element-mobilizing transposase RayT
MPREPRIEVPGGYYHVSSRGNRGCTIFEDDYERGVFLSLLSTAASRWRWTCHAFVLMSNHFSPADPARVRRTVERDAVLEHVVCTAFEPAARLRRAAPLSLRFWSELISDDVHLREAARYIVLNPVRADICSAPEDWRWSSYRACAGLDFAPRFLAAGEHLRLFAGTPPAARRAYRAFVADGVIEGASPGVRHRDGSRTR